MLNKEPHDSTGLLYLYEKQALENETFRSEPVSALGAEGRPSGRSLFSITYKSHLLNREETLATISTTNLGSEQAELP